MVDGTLALSIPALFLTCVQYLSLIQLGRDFEDDFGFCVLELRAIELRLVRWGKAVGITDEQSEDFVRKLEQDYTTQEAKFAQDACKQIVKQLARAQEDSKDISELNGDSKELVLIDEAQQLEQVEKKVARASRVQAKLKSGYKKSFDVTSKVFVRAKWALYKKDQLSNLLAAINKHVAQLESLFPRQSPDLAAVEAKDMEPEVIQTLKPIADAMDPLLSRALQVEAGRQGFIFENLEANDNARVQWGNNYGQVPQTEGRQVYRGIRSGGNSISQAGNNYGIPILPVHNVPVGDHLNPGRLGYHGQPGSQPFNFPAHYTM